MIAFVVIWFFSVCVWNAYERKLWVSATSEIYNIKNRYRLFCLSM